MPSVDKLQRWVDLLVALLRHRAGLTFDDLAGEVPAYRAVLGDEIRIGSLLAALNALVDRWLPTPDSRRPT